MPSLAVAHLVLLWLTGLYLRLTVYAAAPLAPRIADDLDLGQAVTGALTTLPVLMLAVSAVPVSRVASRLGARRTVGLGLFVVALASAGRSLAPDAWLMLLITATMGLGIAAMQTALPSLVREWTPTRVALGSAVYLNGMMAGEFVGGGLTLPVALQLAGGDWRVTLASWSVPALAVVVWLLIPSAPRLGCCDRIKDRTALWSSPRTWGIGMLLGSAITTFLALNAYMGSVLEQRNELDHLPVAIGLLNLAGAGASVIMLRLADRWAGRSTPLYAAMATSALGLLGFVALPGPAAIAAAAVAGFSAGIQLILVISSLPRMASGDALNGLVAGVYTIGYMTGFLVPLAGGALADVWGNSSLGPVPALLLVLAILPFGIGRFVETPPLQCKKLPAVCSLGT